MFFAADRNIRLGQLEAERQRLSQEWLANPNRQPDVRLRPTAPALVIQSYEGLRTAVRHGDACRQIGSLECSQRVVIGNAVEAAFEDFSPRSSDQPEGRARLQEEFCQAAIICKQTGNLRAVQILLGHTKIETTVRCLGVEVEDALALAEGTEVQAELRRAIQPWRARQLLGELAPFPDVRVCSALT
jgi:hypothetical protein